MVRARVSDCDTGDVRNVAHEASRAGLHCFNGSLRSPIKNGLLTKGFIRANRKEKKFSPYKMALTGIDVG